MKIIFALLISVLFCLSIVAQEATPENDSTGVASIELARDSGGEVGERTTSFLTTDIPIRCLIELATAKAVTVKMNVVAVAAHGLKPERSVVSVVYKTDGRQTDVTFTASPEKIWAAGKYRVDILLDGKPAKSLDFEIQKSPAQIEKEKKAAMKPKTKSRRTKT